MVFLLRRSRASCLAAIAHPFIIVLRLVSREDRRETVRVRRTTPVSQRKAKLLHEPKRRPTLYPMYQVRDLGVELLVLRIVMKVTQDLRIAVERLDATVSSRYATNTTKSIDSEW